MKRAFYQVAVPLCCLTTQPVVTLDLTSQTDGSAATAELSSEDGFNDHDFMPMLPQLTATTPLLLEPYEDALTDNPTLA